MAVLIMPTGSAELLDAPGPGHRRRGRA